MALAVGAVAVILLMGTGTFGTGGEFNRKNANKIMRWRIGAQAIAVLMIVVFVYLRKNGG